MNLYLLLLFRHVRRIIQAKVMRQFRHQLSVRRLSTSFVTMTVILLAVRGRAISLHRAYFFVQILMHLYSLAPRNLLFLPFLGPIKAILSSVQFCRYHLTSRKGTGSLCMLPVCHKFSLQPLPAVPQPCSKPKCNLRRQYRQYLFSSSNRTSEDLLFGRLSGSHLGHGIQHNPTRATVVRLSP